MAFLPINRADMRARGWDSLDFILISGDAYVDHPSFGSAIIARVLESQGFRVGIIAQPDWTDLSAFQVLGRPELAFLVSAGNMDSMVSHYTAAKKPRRSDAYSPGGARGKRPDRACIVYTSKVKQAYKGVPLILGGIEASLRRLAHYDYWSKKLRRSLLLDAKADLLLYGMAERSIRAVAKRLAAGESIATITDIRGTVCKLKEEQPLHGVILPSFEEIQSSKDAFNTHFALQYRNTDAINGEILYEKSGDFVLKQNPPALPLEEADMDAVYALAFERAAHPSYTEEIPALKEVEFSLTSNRGCFGSCHYCALGFHQGRIIQTRSHESLLKEAKTLVKHPRFKGYIHDVGGPTANFRHTACRKQKSAGACKDRNCLFPKPCPHLLVDHKDFHSLLKKIAAIDSVKKVFVRSGIRYDYLLLDKQHSSFLKDFCAHNISGQLKVAPEHASSTVLELMGKADIAVFDRFTKEFDKHNKALGKKQYLIPYLISSHPGSDLNAAIELALYLKRFGFIPDQVQDFYPTPGTLSTAMYYSEKHPLTGETVYVPKDPAEKAMQKALIHFHKAENHALVKKALIQTGRTDLIPVLLGQARKLPRKR